MRVSIAMLMLVMASGVGLAHRNAWSLKDMVSLSELILVAEITGLENAESGYKFAKIKPIEIIKSESGDGDKAIRYGNPVGGPQEDSTDFKIGEKYVLFLRNSEKCYLSIGNYGDQYIVDRHGQVRAENGDVVTVRKFVKRIRALIEGCK